MSLTTVSQLDLPLRLDRTAAEPLQRQLLAQLRAAIIGGQLAAGTRLPSTRVLATALGVSRNVVVSAFDELFAEGYVAGRHGSGTYVEDALPVAPRRAPAPPPGGRRWLQRDPVPIPGGVPPDDDAPGLISFRPGVPAIELLPPEVWRRVWRAAGELPPARRYADPAGDPELRAALARWVGRARGIACGPDEVIVTTGAAQALDLLARATLTPGDSVAFEEPGYPTGRSILKANGARIVPVPVDDDGLRVEALPTGADAPLLACVTPSHQYPLGARLPVARRLALLDWASTNDGLIVEDDYDSEFRFDAPPLPALMSLDKDGRVAYIGTFAKSLAPSLRLGYLIVPAPLRARVIALKGLLDRQTSLPVQRVVLSLITEGHLERHIRRARRRYAEDRAILRAGLAPVTSGPDAPASLRGLDAGLHVCLEFAPGIDQARVVTLARRRGVAVATLDDYYHGPPDRQGLILGYGGLAPNDLARGTRILAEVIAESRG